MFLELLQTDRTLNLEMTDAAKALVIVVMHDLDLALRFCDRLVLLDRGKVAADIPGTDCLRNASLPAMFGQWRAEAADGAGGAA